MLTWMFMIPTPVHIYADTLDIQANSAILVDAGTGKVLYEKEADKTLPPASMTKIMTEYLVLEAINKGEINWDTTTQISDYPYSISANPAFSGLGLRQDHPYTVRELYEAMAIYSDNGTTIALAELVAGSEGEFVKRMNDKAEEMGLPDYQFVNSTGLSNQDLGSNYPKGTDPEADNLLSARSTALLSYHLINEYPEALSISSITVKEFEGHIMENWNWMLPEMPGYLADFGYEGMDGLKTGWTDLAGFCFAGTAERNGTRLISVVMRTDSKEARFNETRKLMDYGFNQFEKKQLFPSGHKIDDESTLPVTKGKKDMVEIASQSEISTVIKHGEEELYSVEYYLDETLFNDEGELTAPIEKGTKVGTMHLTYNGENDYGYITDIGSTIETVDVVTQSSVEKANWFALVIRSILDFFSDIFSSVVNGIKGLF